MKRTWDRRCQYWFDTKPSVQIEFNVLFLTSNWRGKSIFRKSGGITPLSLNDPPVKMMTIPTDGKPCPEPSVRIQAKGEKALNRTPCAPTPPTQALLYSKYTSSSPSIRHPLGFFSPCKLPSPPSLLPASAAPIYPKFPNFLFIGPLRPE